MSSNVKPVPEGFHTVTPHLVIDGAAAAIEFYKQAFNAEELGRFASPDGQKIMHAMIKIGSSRIWLADANPEMGSKAPTALGGTPITMHLYVEDADAVFGRAVDAGATVVMPLADMFWGDRYGLLADPFGHSWAVASHIRDVSPEEMQRAAAEAFS